MKDGFSFNKVVRNWLCFFLDSPISFVSMPGVQDDFYLACWTYYHRQKKRPPIQPPGHRVVAVA